MRNDRDQATLFDALEPAPQPADDPGYFADAHGADMLEIDDRDYDDLAELEPHPDDLPTQARRSVDLSVYTPPARLTDGLNPQQAQAVGHLLGPLMVVAGPGSGKTRVLTHRVGALLDAGVAPWQIMAVTFTNKAAAEMRERLETLVGTEQAQDLWVATFHSVCVRILRANAEAAGLPRSFTIVDTDDAIKLIGNAMQRKGVELDRKELRSLQQEISRTKNQARTVEDLAASASPGDQQLADVWVRYEQELKRVGGADFDDLLGYTLKLLENDEMVRSRYQRKFAHVLVDEYQDTNPVQSRIVGLLAAEADSLMIVGDPDQSIYKFRSAVPELMQSFPDDFDDATVITLDRNYRSTGAILDVVRAVIAPNPSEHRPALTTAEQQGAPVRVYTARDDRDEATWVASQIQRSSSSYDQHAILVRARAQTRVIEEALKGYGIVYDVVGALKFYDRAEVKDALSYLKVAMNPSDTVAFTRAVSTPKRGIGPAAIAKVDLDAAEFAFNLIEACRHAGSATKRSRSLEAFAVLIDDIARVAAERGPVAALKRATDTSGLRDHVRKNDDGLDRVENLDELISSAAAYVTNDTNRTVDGTPVVELGPLEQTVAFLENVALVSSGEEKPAVGGRVQVVTTHMAKGKEWPHVWVVGVEDGLYPHQRSTTRDEVAEERRLLFVACSRAQHTLTLSVALRRALFGNQYEDREPSPFLQDLPDEVEQIGSEAPAAVTGNVDQFRRRSARPSQAAQIPRRAQRVSTRRSGSTTGRSGSSRRPAAKRPAAARPEPEFGQTLTQADCYVGQIVRSPSGIGTVERVKYGIVVVRTSSGATSQHTPDELTSL